MREPGFSAFEIRKFQWRQKPPEQLSVYLQGYVNNILNGEKSEKCGEYMKRTGICLS
jgi:hypothetical protein